MGERITVPIHLRWGDLDAYGHVNNATMLRLLEEARVRTFWEGEDRAGEQVLTLIARQEIEYLAPMPYSHEPIRVEMWISRLGGSSLEVSYEIHSPATAPTDVVYVRAATVIVFVAAATGAPTRLPDGMRDRWSQYLGDPVHFRR